MSGSRDGERVMKAQYNEVKRPRSYLQSIKEINYWEKKARGAAQCLRE